MTDPIELIYDLHLLAPGRLPFRRWRWELWHGPQLLAAGWRLSVLHAQRALRGHAVRYAHRLHGLHPLRPDAAKLAAAPAASPTPKAPSRAAAASTGTCRAAAPRRRSSSVNRPSWPSR